MKNRIKAALKELDCPFVDVNGDDAEFLDELIYQQGETRVKLLQWLLTQLDPMLEEQLNTAPVPPRSKNDPRIERILSVVSSLGLCAADDIDIIKGNDKSNEGKQQQQDFTDDLILLANTATYDNLMKYTKGDCVPLLGYNSACDLIDELAAGNEAMFPNKLELLPPNVSAYLDERKKQKSPSSRSPFTSSPDLSQLTQMSTELETRIKIEYEYINTLQPAEVYDADILDNESRRLKFVLSEFKQLALNFNISYESELLLWGDREAPAISPLGETMATIHRMLTNFMGFLETLDSVKLSYASAVAAKDSIVSAKQKEEESLDQMKKKTLDAFQECIVMLSKLAGEDSDATWKSKVKLT